MFDFIGGLSGTVSSLFDRFISAIETVIDTFVSKIKTLWEENKPLAIGLAVATALGVAIVIPFIPEVIGVIKSVVGVISKIFQGLMSMVGNLIKGAMSKVGARA